MPKLKRIDEIRRDNTRSLAEKSGGNARFAEKIDRSTTQVSRFIGKKATKNIGDDLARHIEQCFGMADGWLDHDWNIDGSINESQAQYKPDTSTPIYNLKDIEYENRQPKLKLLCPVRHSANSYGAFVPDNTMESTMGPSYPEGSIIFIDPERAKEAKHGDLIVFRLSDSGVVGFKRLVDNETIRGLEPLNIRYPMVPQQDFEIIGLVIGCWINPAQSR